MLLMLFLLFGAAGASLSQAPLFEAASTVYGDYIVKLKSPDLVNKFESDLEEQSKKISEKFYGFGHVDVKFAMVSDPSMLVMGLDYRSLEMVRQHAAVEYVEEDGWQQLQDDVESDEEISERADFVNDLWALDRINQVGPEPDGNFSFSGNGYGVHIYVIDTGVRISHDDFDCRGRRSYDVFGGENDDCREHGTSVAGVAAGRTVGVAKAAFIHSVKTLDCNGNAKTSQIAKSIDWVTDNHITPCVVTLSLSSQASNSIEKSLVRLGTETNCIPVAAASNEEKKEDKELDACTRIPAASPHVITVAAMKLSDKKSWYTRYGVCVDIFAPGDNVQSLSSVSDTDFVFNSGTSQSCPFVAGVAAIHLGNGVPPEQVRTRIMNDATPCAIIDAGAGTPNRLLYVDP